MFEVERDGDEVIVRHEDMFDISTDLKEIVMSLRQARALSEALLEETMVPVWDLENEDG